jgi:glucuronokinase
MDFDKETMDRLGHGVYKEIDTRKLPKLFMAYRKDLGEGSEVFHNNIRERWELGDQVVIDAMKQFAQFAQDAYDLIQANRGTEIGPLLDANFNLRQSLFRLDPRNVDMVERARSVGAHAKFSGSGGAIVGVYTDDAMYEALEKVMKAGDIAVFKPRIEA